MKRSSAFRKCFVTGGAGFIGSHLVDRLMKENAEVTVYDNLSSGKKKWIEHHIGKSNFTLIEADLLDLPKLESAMAGHDIIFHFGANTNIRDGINDLGLDLKNCTIATSNVLHAMKNNQIKEIIFTSSSAIYGDLLKTPKPESAGPLLPVSLYGAGKLACEGLISAYCYLFGLQAWIFRFANVEGTRLDRGVIHDFIYKLRKNPKELEILGNGKGEKNYFLVEDCLDGIFCAYYDSKNQCDVFNLGCEVTAQIDRVAAIVIEEMGLKNVKFSYTGGERGWPGDAPQCHFNLDKMKALGWQPKHTSEEAVRITTRRMLGKE